MILAGMCMVWVGMCRFGWRYVQLLIIPPKEKSRGLLSPGSDLCSVVKDEGDPSIPVYDSLLHHDHPDGVIPPVQHYRLLLQRPDEQRHVLVLPLARIPFSLQPIQLVSSSFVTPAEIFVLFHVLLLGLGGGGVLLNCRLDQSGHHLGLFRLVGNLRVQRRKILFCQNRFCK